MVKPSKTVTGVVAGLLLLCGACAGSPQATTRSPTTTTSGSSSRSPTSSTTTTVPGAGPPAGTAVPSGFDPGSVTFVSTTTGFVIGVDSSCPGGTCVALARTTDGGSSWAALPAPSAAYVAHGGQPSSTLPDVAEVRFADELDGWIYGPSLFATHDGGASWRRVNLAGSVISLETSGGFVDAVVSPCTGEQVCTGWLELYQAPAAGGSFVRVLTGPSTSSSGLFPALSLHAPVGFVDMSAAGGTGLGRFYATEQLAGLRAWKSFPDPCAGPSAPDVVSFVAPDAVDLYTLCAGGAAAGSVAKELVRTTRAVSVTVGAPPSAGDPEGLAATGSGTFVVTAASGASWLYRSTDGGAHWTTVATFDDGGIGFNDLGFTTATQGVVVHGSPGPPADFSSQLLMTRDGGATWSPLSIS